MPTLALSLLLLVVGALYLPGAQGPFLLDDFAAIVDNLALRSAGLDGPGLLQAALSSNAGPFGRMLPMASFAVDHALGGLTPEAFKRTNILLHLAITVLVYLLARSLCAALDETRPSPARALDDAGRRWVPVLVAALWALHPQHVSTVLYVVQRMSQLAMLFVLWATWVYVDARRRQLAGDWRGGAWRMVLLVPPLFLAALLSKENGALLPVLLLTIELTFFRFALPGGKQASALARLPFALMMAAALALLGYLGAVGLGFTNTGSLRDFTPWERLLTQPRLLTDYLLQLVWPVPTSMPFYYDWVAPSRGLLDPTGTLPAALLWLGLTAVACVWRTRRPIFAFAVLWFLAGHLLESTSIPLELGFEHRNYLPAFGLAFAAGFGLWRLGQAAQLTQIGQHPTSAAPWRRALLAVLPLLALAWPLHARVAAWSSTDAFFTTALRNAPASARAWGDYSFHLSAVGQYREAVPPLLKAAELNPREAGYPLAAINLVANALGETPDAQLQQEATRRLRQYPLSAYGHNIVGALLEPLIDQRLTPQGRAALPSLLETALANPTLKPDHRKTVGLALIYLARTASHRQDPNGKRQLH